jgi:hypothetical protein
MTVHALPPTSPEAFGSAGMMMPARVDARCRMCA